MQRYYIAILGYWNPGKFRGNIGKNSNICSRVNIGILEYYYLGKFHTFYPGILKYWNIGTLENSNIPIYGEYRKIEILESWKFSIFPEEISEH